MKNIYDELRKPFPEEAIERTRGNETHKGYDTTGIKYQYIINRLNDVLGIGKFRVEREFSIMEKTSASGKPMYEVCCDIMVQLGEWKDGEFIPMAEALATGGHTAGNIADGKKGAYTNAFKKAAAFFGCGWQAYAGTLDDDNTAEDSSFQPAGNKTETQELPPQNEPGRVTHAQLGKIRQLVDQIGGSWDEYKTYVQGKYHKQVNYLSKREASTLIDELIRRAA